MLLQFSISSQPTWVTQLWCDNNNDAGSRAVWTCKNTQMLLHHHLQAFSSMYLPKYLRSLLRLIIEENFLCEKKTCTPIYAALKEERVTLPQLLLLVVLEKSIILTWTLAFLHSLKSSKTCRRITYERKAARSIFTLSNNRFTVVMVVVVYKVTQLSVLLQSTK